MATYRVQISFPADSALPRDEMSITPHFSGDAPSALADALAQNLITFGSVGAKPFKIKVYDALKAPPSYPLATQEQVGAAPATGVPREITMCLSYYSNFNRPSFRGRLYLPYTLIGGVAGTRPSTAQQQAVLDFSDVLTQGLPAGHRWVVWSKKNHQANDVTHIWCDNEWDTQRSRGMRGDARLTQTV